MPLAAAATSSSRSVARRQRPTISSTAQAQTAAAILGYNYQASPFYQDAFNLLKGKGLAPEAKGNSWLAKIYRQMIRGEWL